MLRKPRKTEEKFDSARDEKNTESGKLQLSFPFTFHSFLDSQSDLWQFRRTKQSSSLSYSIAKKTYNIVDISSAFGLFHINCHRASVISFNVSSTLFFPSKQQRAVSILWSQHCWLYDSSHPSMDDCRSSSPPPKVISHFFGNGITWKFELLC